MTRLRFRYYMRLSFDGVVKQHHFTLKCIPRSEGSQRIEELHREIYPNTFISEGKDSFGNDLIYGYEETEHKCFFFDVSGVAVTGLKCPEAIQKEKENGDTGEYQADWKTHMEPSHKHRMVKLYKYQTELTKPGEALLKMADRLSTPCETDKIRNQIAFAENYYGCRLENAGRYAIWVMNRLAECFQYRSGVTEIGTTAEEAFACGMGVCQDYAQIMLSLCRIKRIPCRYVTGMLVGEGASHAWVEVYTNGMWIPLDPTNQILVTDQHIKIAHGRDFSDTMVNQGVFIGNVTQKQDITVIVEQI